MSDLLERGFVAIQNIKNARQSIDLPATYFLDVTGQDDDASGHNEDEKMLKALIEDFTEGKDWDPVTKTGKLLKKKYLRAYVHVTSTLQKTLIAKVLATERRFVASCRALNEINIDFLAYESRVFLLNQPYVLDTLMRSNTGGGMGESTRLIDRITKQLVSLCVMLNEKPYVRFEKPTSNSNCEKLLEMLASTNNFEAMLREATDKLPNWKPRPNPATLLFLNRTTDMAATLVHHIGYQSVLTNVLGMQGDVLRVEVDKKGGEGKEIKSYVMSEDDDIWARQRHKHFDAVKNELYAEMTAFKQKSLSQKVKEGDGLDMDPKTMLKVVKDIPKYREMARQFNKHNSILNAARAEINKPGRIQAMTMLQDLACGFDSTGSSVSPQSLWSAISELLAKPDTAYLDKMQLALLYVIARGGMTSKEEDFFESNLQPEMMTVIKGLSHLDINTKKPKNTYSVVRGHLDMMKARLTKIRNAKKIETEKEQDAKRKGQSFTKKAHYIGYRYLPKLHWVCSQLIEEKLDQKAYPWNNPPPKSGSRGMSRATGFSVRRNRHKRQQSGMGNGDKQRVIVFVLGGITPAEMASVYEIGDQYNVEIIIGSTDLITSEEIVKCLSQGEIKRDQDLNPAVIQDTNV
uniref:Uncharacterized protein n=1 Tax=Lotharella oceanica TaxID=641309 RepID=A0A7S2TZM9_9EUKA